jgi:hypothetical protein
MIQRPNSKYNIITLRVVYTRKCFNLIYFLCFRDSVKRIDSKIKKGLFLFAVSNSCMDPIVYGMFTSMLIYVLSKIQTNKNPIFSILEAS